MYGGTRYIQKRICKKCGFTQKIPMRCWGDCDFEDKKIESKNCPVCQRVEKEIRENTNLKMTRKKLSIQNRIKIRHKRINKKKQYE